MEINYEAIRAWDAWLRDPNNHQGIGTLRENGRVKKYCCLGGLCEVSKALGLKGVWVKEEGKWYFGPSKATASYEGSAGVLPFNVRKFVGIDHSNPMLRVPARLRDRANGALLRESASVLNDTFHFTFPEIADCIRETWPEAFTTNATTDAEEQA